jgi:hypothetical protein
VRRPATLAVVQILRSMRTGTDVDGRRVGFTDVAVH